MEGVEDFSNSSREALRTGVEEQESDLFFRRESRGSGVEIEQEHADLLGFDSLDFGSRQFDGDFFLAPRKLEHEDPALGHIRKYVGRLEDVCVGDPSDVTRGIGGNWTKGRGGWRETEDGFETTSRC